MTIRKLDPVSMFMLAVLAFLMVLLFSGCSTAKELLDKAEKKDPAIVAKYARDKFPCTDLLKPDTLTVYQDSLVYIDCPSEGTDIITFVDTLNTRVPGKTIRVPVNIPVRTQIVTKWYEDSAKLRLAAIDRDACNKINQKLTADNEKLAGKVKTRTKYLWWLLALCIGLTVWTFRKLFI